MVTKNISQPTQCIAKPKLSSPLNHLLLASEMTIEIILQELIEDIESSRPNNGQTAGELPWWENGDFTGKSAGFSWFFTISVIGKLWFFARILLWAKMGKKLRHWVAWMGFQHLSGPAGYQCFAPRTWLNIYIYIYMSLFPSQLKARMTFLGIPHVYGLTLFHGDQPLCRYGDPMISPWNIPVMVALIASLLVKSPCK